MELGVEIGKLLVAFLVLINPFSALSIYLDLTQNHSTKEKRRIARTAALAVFIVIIVFALGGGILLKVLGISVGSFQVGGGILVLLIAISLMNGNDNPAKPKIDPHSEEHQSAQQVHRNEKAIAVVPIAIPITIGPGGISTVIIYSSAAKNYSDIALIIIAGFLVSLICYFILVVAGRISKRLGNTGLTILNRIMGMMLAAISVEIIVAGLKSIFPQLVA
ncbi:MarC family protein [Neisseria subflava]|uniref:MarC family protein n=1 Tax=Neisseria subflava TaxID=28449 RepID=UPI0020B6DDC2|nr:MarC family protein [Neisseria subflava]UTG74014.1 MarC family protein [Neisseria subflava]